MQDVLGYRGKTVVITGCATGMGASAAEMLVELGAEVWGLDLHDVKAPIHRSIRVDMKDKATLDAAIRHADRLTRLRTPDAIKLIDMQARWRQQPPTPAQIAVLQRCGIPIPEGLTRGGASWIIALAPRS